MPPASKPKSAFNRSASYCRSQKSLQKCSSRRAACGLDLDWSSVPLKQTCVTSLGDYAASTPMKPASKSSFLDRVLGRIGRLDAEGLQTVIQRLARERSFLETLFNTIEDGVLVVDELGRVIYFNQAVVRLLRLSRQGGEVQHIAP